MKKKTFIYFISLIPLHWLSYSMVLIKQDLIVKLGPDHVQVNSRRLQGLKKLLVILRSQGLDQEIDSIIGRSHHPPTH